MEKDSRKSDGQKALPQWERPKPLTPQQIQRETDAEENRQRNKKV